MTLFSLMARALHEERLQPTNSYEYKPNNQRNPRIDLRLARAVGRKRTQSARDDRVRSLHPERRCRDLAVRSAAYQSPARRHAANGFRDTNWSLHIAKREIPTAI